MEDLEIWSTLNEMPGKFKIVSMVGVFPWYPNSGEALKNSFH